MLRYVCNKILPFFSFNLYKTGFRKKASYTSCYDLCVPVSKVDEIRFDVHLK